MPRSERVNAFAAGHSFLWSTYSLFFPSIPVCSFVIWTERLRSDPVQQDSSAPAVCQACSYQRCGKADKTRAFPSRLPRLQSSVMALFRRYDSQQLVRATSDLSERVQRLESEHAALRARLEGERHLRILTAHIAAAAEAAPSIGAAIERFAEAMRAPLPLVPRGRAGGLARALTAWRYFDGTFMPESERQAAYLQAYERYAAGGRARARSARRHSDGTFA